VHKDDMSSRRHVSRRITPQPSAQPALEREVRDLAPIWSVCVLRFTYSTIDERPAEVTAMVCEALEVLGAA
jgi:hypothetical protein